MKKQVAHFSSPVLTAAVVLFCNASQADQSWQVHYQRWQDAEINVVVNGESSSIDRAEYFVAYQWQTPASTEKLSYTHQPVLIRVGKPAHNGYFHRLDFTYESVIDRVEFSFTGGLHGSSNMFNHAKFHSDALVISATAMLPLPTTTGKVGFGADHRFGHFRIYPQLYWEHVFDNGQQLVINFPAHVHWWVRPQRWQVGFESYGEKWGALDADRKVESAFYLREYRLFSRWSLPHSRLGDWQLSVGVSMETQVEYLDLQLGRRQQQLDTAVFAAIGAEFGA